MGQCRFCDLGGKGHRAGCPAEYEEPPPPTLAEAVEVIEALLGDRAMLSTAPWDAAREFLGRVKGRP